MLSRLSASGIFDLIVYWLLDESFGYDYENGINFLFHVMEFDTEREINIKGFFGAVKEMPWEEGPLNNFQIPGPWISNIPLWINVCHPHRQQIIIIKRWITTHPAVWRPRSLPPSINCFNRWASEFYYTPYSLNFGTPLYCTADNNGWLLSCLPVQ